MVTNRFSAANRRPAHADSSTWRSAATSAATPANALPSTIHDMMMHKSLHVVSATWKRAQRTGSKLNRPNL
jgi:hypothetical protein